MQRLRPLDEQECYLRCYGWVGEEDAVTVLRPEAESSEATAVLTERIRLAFEALAAFRAGLRRFLRFSEEAAGESPAENVTQNTYDGKGGVDIGSAFNKLLYAVKFSEPNIVLSNRVNENSKILYDRHPRDRVAKVAPWLTIDGDPYPAVVDGRVVWIVDGYTTSDNYPYSEKVSLDEATSDTLTGTGAQAVLPSDQVNYMRNAVKGVVDAYDGSVDLYQWDTEDPVLKTWMKAFRDTVKPRSAISDSLMAHLRYPEDLFKVQRQLLASYHVTDANSFYGGGDFWQVPKDPTHATQDQPVYYQSLKMPDQDAPAFSLTTTFIPRGSGREILRGFLAVDSDAGSTAGRPAEGYGTMRLLELPRNSAVDGPGQVQNQIEVSTARSQSPSEPLNLRSFGVDTLEQAFFAATGREFEAETDEDDEDREVFA